MPPIKQNKGTKKKKRVKKKNDKISILTKQLEQVQEEVLQLEQQARVLCTSVVRCENKLFPFMDPTNIQNMSMDDYEIAHSELQEMLFDCRQIMDKITHEKNNLLELIDSLGLLEEDKTRWMFSCSICKAEIQDADFLEIHLATEHVQYWAYECETCDFSKFPSDFALRKHYANVHKVENFTIKYKVTPELEQKRQELKDLLIHSLAGTSSSQISKQLTPEPNPPSGTITVRRLDKQGTTGPPIKLLKTTNDSKSVPISINISTKTLDAEKFGGQSSSLVEIACSSTNYVSPSKNIVKIEPEHENNDKEANEKDEKDSATGLVVEEAPWGQLFSENAESNASVLSELSLAQTGYKYNENGRCYRGYDEEFKKIYPEIQESKKGDRFFYCTVCRKDVCIGVSGTRGPIRLIQQHYDTIKHKKLAELAKKSDDAVYQALNPKAWGRYRSKFTKMWPEIKSSERGECYFYCTICERDLVIAQGISSVSNHLKTTRHLTNAQKKSGLTTTVAAMVNEDTPQKQLELIAAKQESMEEDIEGSFSHQADLEASSSNQDFEPLQESEFTVPWVKVEPVIYEEETVETNIDFSNMPMFSANEPGSSDVYLKRPMSAYFKWTLAERPKLRHQHPELSNNEVSKKLGEIWKAMSEEEKKPYFDQMRKLWDEFPNWLYKPKRPRGTKQQRGKVEHKDKGSRPRIYNKKDSKLPGIPSKFNTPKNEIPGVNIEFVSQAMELSTNDIKEEVQDEYC